MRTDTGMVVAFEGYADSYNITSTSGDIIIVGVVFDTAIVNNPDNRTEVNAISDTGNVILGGIGMCVAPLM